MIIRKSCASVSTTFRPGKVQEIYVERTPPWHLVCRSLLYCLGAAAHLLEVSPRSAAHCHHGKPHGLVLCLRSHRVGGAPGVGLAETSTPGPADGADLFARGDAVGGQLVHLHLGCQFRLCGGEQPGLFHYAAGECAPGHPLLPRAPAQRTVGGHWPGRGGRRLLDQSSMGACRGFPWRWPSPLAATG